MGERSRDSAVVVDEPSVEDGEPQETLQLLMGRRCGPFLHCPDLAEISLKPCLGYLKSKEADLSRVEFTLLRFNEQSILQGSLKHRSHLLDVFIMSSGVDHVVQVDKTKWFNMSQIGRRLAQLVERASHVPRLCNGPRFDSRPGSFCCMSLPLSLPLFPVISSAYLSIIAIKRPKKYLKNKNMSQSMSLIRA